MSFGPIDYRRVSKAMNGDPVGSFGPVDYDRLREAMVGTAFAVRPADVIVYRDGDEAVAVDRFGKVVAKSDDHAEVIQTAVESIYTGTIVLMPARGAYIIRKPIRFGDRLVSIRLVGMAPPHYGRTGTNWWFEGDLVALYADADIDAIIDLSEARGVVELQNILMWAGDKANYGIKAVGGHCRLYLDGIWIDGGKKWGLVYHDIRGDVSNWGHVIHRYPPEGAQGGMLINAGVHFIEWLDESNVRADPYIPIQIGAHPESPVPEATEEADKTMAANMFITFLHVFGYSEPVGDLLAPVRFYLAQSARVGRYYIEGVAHNMKFLAYWKGTGAVFLLEWGGVPANCDKLSNHARVVLMGVTSEERNPVVIDGDTKPAPGTLGAEDNPIAYFNCFYVDIKNVTVPANSYKDFFVYSKLLTPSLDPDYGTSRKHIFSQIVHMDPVAPLTVSTMHSPGGDPYYGREIRIRVFNFGTSDVTINLLRIRVWHH